MFVMVRKVKNISMKDKDNFNRSNTIPVNLLLSEFYDGTQLFKSIAVDFLALLIGILNLPPSFLAGDILSLRFTKGSHAFTERALFIDFFCKEFMS